MASADPEKRKRSKALQDELNGCRERLKVLNEGKGKATAVCFCPVTAVLCFMLTFFFFTNRIIIRYREESLFEEIYLVIHCHLIVHEFHHTIGARLGYNC